MATMIASMSHGYYDRQYVSLLSCRNFLAASGARAAAIEVIYLIVVYIYNVFYVDVST